MSRCLAGLLLILAFAFTSLPAVGQGVYDGNQNLPPFGSFTGGKFDTIALQNGNLHISIPILNVAGRGSKLPAEYDFVFDTPSYSATWIPHPTQYHPYNGAFILSNNPNMPVQAGWRLVSPFDSWQLFSTRIGVTCSNGQQYDIYTNYTLFDPQGVGHPVPLRQEGDGSKTACIGNVVSAPTLDGSGIWVVRGPGGGTLTSVILKDGTRVGPTIEDSNGNAIAPNKDTTGRPLLAATNQGTTSYLTLLGYSVPGPQYTTWEYTDSNGQSQTFRLDYEAIDIQTAFCGHGLSAGTGTCEDYSSAILVPKKLTLPDGVTYYSFGWDTSTPVGTGELLSIGLPTGGLISYTYGNLCLVTGASTDGPISAPHTCRRSVQSRTVSSISGSWSYAIAAGSSTVTDPYGNYEVHDFASLNSSVNTVETKVQSYASGGSLLRTVATTYTNEMGGDPNGYSQVINIRPIRKTTTLDNGLVTKNETDYETFSFNGASSYTVTRLNPTAVREYDYGSGGPGPLLRQDTYTYLHTGNQSYITPNIVDRVLTKTVLNGSGTQIAKTTYQYDNYNQPSQPSGYQSMQASGAVQHDSVYNTSYIHRGNVTAVQNWLNTNGALLTTTNQYDDAGNVISTLDPKGNFTTYSFTDAWSNTACVPSGQAKAYVSKVTNALNQAATNTYDSCTGLRASTTDPNSQTTRYTYDFAGRTTLTGFPDGGQTSNIYNDSARTVESKSLQTGSSYVVRCEVYDQLGQKISDQLDQTGADSCPNPISTDYTYDSLGRLATQSNPHISASSPTDGVTQYQYDALSRIVQTTEPDSSVQKESYSGNCTTVTDEASKMRKSCTDGLGRMTGVWEDPNGLDLATTYTYDTLDDLVTVLQDNSRPRSFTYDSLSRLTSASNPEISSGGVSCPVTYTYDSDGNELTKTSPRTNQTSCSTTVTATNTYDALDRLTGTTYSDGSQAATYVYDTSGLDGFSLVNTIGRMVESTNDSGTNEAAKFISYDVMGRPNAVWNCLYTGICFQFSMTYNLLGSMTKLIYPGSNPLTINYSQSAVGLPLSAVDTNGTGYVSNANYSPPGAPCSEVFGSAITATWLYNSRLQPVRIQTTTSSAPPTPCAAPSQTGNLLDLTLSFNSGTDNGNVIGITNNRDNTRSQSFTYDSLNRLLTAETASTYATSPAHCWGEAYVYDNQPSGGAWGNLTNINVASTAYNGCTQESLSVIATAQNQLNGYGYDAAGNMTSIPSVGGYSFNASNELTSAGGVTYTYDPSGHRVEKSSGTLYLYGPGDSVLEETTLSGTLVNQYIYFGSARVARRDASGNVFFYSQDHLGTSRVLAEVPSGQSTATLCYDADFYPFGGERVYSNTCAQNYKFTGKERDSESGLDNFGARYDSSQMGRFMSPDPDDDSGFENQDDPQSWNAYSYVRNNSMNLTDLDGRDYRVCVDNGNGGWNCVTYANSNDFQKALDGTGATLNGTDKNGQIVVNVNGQNVVAGTYSYFVGPGVEGGGVQEDSILAPVLFGGLVGGLKAGVRGIAVGVFGGGAKTVAEEVTVATVTDAATGAAGSSLTPGTVFNEGRGLLGGEAELSSHAAAQAAARGVTKEEIAEALSHVPKQYAGDGSVIKFFGKAAEVRVNKVTGTIVTVIRKLSPGAPSPLP